MRGHRWALVTSNAERRVVRRFERVGLPLPATIVDNAATVRGKPAPDPYLRGAELLGVDPGDCLVIEDSPAGVAAGVAAGMTVWSVNRAEPFRAPTGRTRRFATRHPTSSRSPRRSDAKRPTAEAEGRFEVTQ